ncbi:hypothetical protein INN71_11965 [Nocardioides sp. ChNu-153]|uniref:hypothetical protein n=1 Tax=unclassified Nocardioides TaxID=2615069 RepID=UPI0024058DCF|nr:MULTISPECIES: hypothetical protein [unclassified Nocardioides]MDF9717484.1 hypothetical protein [Nocardioides sp. ChNu-99]MDN7122105.1 hypothetical protein [Nocardioides sp. ChNu-153]
MVDENDDRPVLVGVIALVGVGLVVGLIVGLVALGGVRVLGLSGGGGGGGGEAAEPTLVLPEVSLTDSPTGPLITLTPEGEGGSEDAEESEEPEPAATTTTTTAAAAPEITLQASTTSAGVMDRIDISGVYTGGDGAILTIQRFTDGSWNDIAANTSVSGGLYSTYIALGRPGENRIRAVDDSTGLASNEVTIQIG